MKKTKSAKRKRIAVKYKRKEKVIKKWLPIQV